MNRTLRVVSALLAAYAASVQAAPSRIRSRSLLGSSFGVPGVNATYEYIIVGGGTAGLTLATRLSEQQTGRVAVIEAGSFYEIDNGNISQVPASDGYFAGTSRDDWQPLVDWGYVTTPQAVSSTLLAHSGRLDLLDLTWTLGIRWQCHSLRTGKMPWRQLGKELYGIPARHAILIPDVGRRGWRSELYF